MLNRAADPRTEDTITFELLSGGEVVGRATFQNGHTRVSAPDDITVAVEELLARPFVDRVRPDERPRGYRRSGRGLVDMLLPGMPEHFIARMRGLWLSFPTGQVVTARETGPGIPAARGVAHERSETSPGVVDPFVRRATLEQAASQVSARSLVRAAQPSEGTRPIAQTRARRSDCGWLV